MRCKWELTSVINCNTKGGSNGAKLGSMALGGGTLYSLAIPPQTCPMYGSFCSATNDTPIVDAMLLQTALASLPSTYRASPL